MSEISKDLAIKYCNNIISGSEEGYIVTNAEMLKQYINQQILDSEMEEVLMRLRNSHFAEHHAVVLTPNEFNHCETTIRKSLSDKNELINEIINYLDTMSCKINLNDVELNILKMLRGNSNG